MKNKLHRFLTLTMACLILLSSTGFAFVEHQCLVRGKSMQLSSKEKTGSCCARSKAAKNVKGTFLKKTDCCKESHKFEKLDVPASSQLFAKSFKALAQGTVWASSSFIFLSAQWILPPLSPLRPDISFSSRFHGRSLLVQIQSFLI
jgi:hypothetical protein